MLSKWKFSTLVLLICFSLAGCSNVTLPNKVGQQPVPPNETAVQEIYKPVFQEIYKSENLGNSRTSATSVPAQGQSLNDFIPKGWKLLTTVQGDCNTDKLTDVVAVIEQDKKWNPIGGIGGDAPARTLLVLFQENTGGYKLVINSSKAILKADEGGVWGDPFDNGLSLDKGILSIIFYGGSRERWGFTYKFRYQDKGWYLIGVTEDYLDTGTGEGTINDYNLVTGEMIKTNTYFDQNTSEKRIFRGRKKLVNLVDFEPIETEF